jgi:hypothetical protein
MQGAPEATALLGLGAVFTGGAAAMVLQILGAVLAVLQVALAVEMILRALRQLGVWNG